MKKSTSPKTKKPTAADKKKLLTRLIIVLILALATFNIVGVVQQEPAVPKLSVASAAGATTPQVLGTSAQTEQPVTSLIEAQKEQAKSSKATVFAVADIGTLMIIVALLFTVRRLKEKIF